VEIIYLSVDPYMRGRLAEIKGHYVGAFEIDKPISAGIIVKVIKSNDSNVV
jgi:NADPH-dependent curcumin reductase CurA